MAFQIVKFIHILAAITAVGINISYAVWLVRAQNNPANSVFALNGIRFLDSRIANPAYGVLLLTGILMMILLPYPILTFWIDAAVVLYAGIAIVGVAFYSPVLKAQIRLAEAGDVTSAAYEQLSRRGQLFGQILTVLVLVILGLMVFKPTL